MLKTTTMAQRVFDRDGLCTHPDTIVERRLTNPRSRYESPIPYSVTACCHCQAVIGTTNEDLVGSAGTAH